MSSASVIGDRRIGRNVIGSGALKWWFAGLGIAGLLTAVITSPSNARSAAGQVWSPFVLVTGLLLIGLVADDDGLFAAAGHRLARTAPNGVVLFVGAVAVVGAVTAVLNLDTSVAFLTPVLVYAARSRGEGEAPLLYGCLLLSNAGSLFLPGSNLTNLIVVGHLHLNGGQFLAHTWAAALAALVVTAAVVAVAEHRALRVRVEDPTPPERPALGLGLVAVVAAAVLVVVLHNAAIPVAAVGVAAVGVRVATRAEQPRRVADVVGVPVLVGLFGMAVALGTLGRVWSGPATLMSHLDPWSTAVVAATFVSAVQQPPSRIALRGASPRPSIRDARRTQPGTEPVRHGLLGLDPLAAGGPNGRRPTLDRQGQSPRRVRCAPLDGRRPRRPCADRDSLRMRWAGPGRMLR